MFIRSLLALGALAACSGDDVTQVESDLVTRSSPCDGVSLVASRDYHPKDTSDGRVRLTGPLAFAVPGTIPVTAGAAGHGKATLTCRTGTGAATTCVYRGHDTKHHRGPYVLDHCEACSNAAAAAADSFVLHVDRGDKQFGATVVELALPGAADASACRGRENFHDRALVGLGGNGRACADCHMESEHFQLTPAAARARFETMTMTGIDDPLFRAIDADDFRTAGAAAHDFTNVIENGLVRVTIALPPNVKLLDCGAAIPCPASAQPTTETVTDVWRSVPSILDVQLTGPDGMIPVSTRGPNPRGGFQLDARIDTLQNQARAALRGHATTALDPTPQWLDDVAHFESAQLTSAEPPLNALELQGKTVFERACAQCHGGPGGTTSSSQGTQGTPTAFTRYHVIFTACPRPVDTVSPPRFTFAACTPSQLENVRTYEITNSGVAPTGTPCGGAAPQPPCVTRVTTSDPGRLLLTGFPQPGGPGDIEHMDVPTLRGISHTAPYFSNNTAATLEDVVEHYKQFFKRVAIQAPAAPLLTTQPGVVPPVHDRPFSDPEGVALVAYLKRL